MPLTLTGSPYEDTRAKRFEVERQNQIRNEPLPGKATETTTVTLRLTDRMVGLRIDGFERAPSGYTTAVARAVEAHGGAMAARLAPVGSLTGRPVNDNAMLLEMNNLGYEVTPL